MNRLRGSRRRFLKSAALSASPLVFGWNPRWSHGKPAAPTGRLRFGLCADPHQDVMHDGESRLKAFVDAMTAEKVDFVLQLGDFCCPVEANRDFLKIWKAFAGPRYHVLGNHDTDGGFNRDVPMKFWGMKARYYSFDARGYHFVVLDGNDKSSTHTSGYPRHINDDQLAWLKDDLAKTQSPTWIFSHQSLEDADGVDNGADARRVLEQANRDVGGTKVVACFNGHHHIDDQTTINGIRYLHINSMSYYWVGGGFRHESYAPDVHEKYPFIEYTVPYQDSLFSLVTIEPSGLLRIDGRTSKFVGPSPTDLGLGKAEGVQRIVAKISDRQLRFGR